MRFCFFSRSSKRCAAEKLAYNCRTVERSPPVRYVVVSPGSRRWPNNGHPPLIRPNYQRPWAANNGQSFQITTTNPRGHAQLARGVENRPRPRRGPLELWLSTTTSECGVCSFWLMWSGGIDYLVETDYNTCSTVLVRFKQILQRYI